MTKFAKNKNIIIFLALLIDLKAKKEFSNIFTKLIPKGFYSSILKKLTQLDLGLLYSNETSFSFAFASATSASANQATNISEYTSNSNKAAAQAIGDSQAGSIVSFSGIEPMKKKELLIGNSSYNWNKNSNTRLPEDLNKLISAYFKSIYCLISKPKFINTPDKIIIEILYYITIPDHNIFKWYNFIYCASNLATAIPSMNSNSNAEQQLKLNQTTNKLIRKIRRKKSIKTILLKNFLIKKTFFNLNNSNIANLYFNKFVIFFKFLSAYFSKPIEFNLIRLHKSDYDSNILAQLFILILKKKNIRIAINKIYNKNNINSNSSYSSYKQSGYAEKGKVSGYATAIISGLYIHIGGRLMREPIIPRLTTKKFEKGAIATGKVHFLDSARITKKNKKGAFTIKIAYAQNLIAS